MAQILTISDHGTEPHFFTAFYRWEMPTEEIRSQGEKRMLEFVGEIWKSKLAHSVRAIGFGLLVVPGEILELKNVVELVVDKNLISVIPREISTLKKLEELSVANNKLTELCDEVRPPSLPPASTFLRSWYMHSCKKCYVKQGGGILFILFDPLETGETCLWNSRAVARRAVFLLEGICSCAKELCPIDFIEQLLHSLAVSKSFELVSFSAHHTAQ